MNMPQEPAYFLVWFGIAILIGLIFLLTRLILKTEVGDEDDDEFTIGDGTGFTGLQGEIPRVAQEKRAQLEDIPAPEMEVRLGDFVGHDLIWRPVRDEPLRYELRAGKKGPLLGIIQWATGAPLYALAWIGGERWVFERRGEYERMRITLRRWENDSWVKHGTLDVHKGALELDDKKGYRFVTPLFNSVSRFTDKQENTLATFDLGEQQGYSDNTMWVVMRPKMKSACRSPLIGLGFFALTVEP